MILAITQPYFFPYIGYFQLLSKADKTVFLDDVNFIKKGWVNRNRILVGGETKFFTAPVLRASQNIKINNTFVDNNTKWKNKFTQTLTHSYSRAPFFKKAFDLVSDTIFANHETISDLAIQSLTACMSYLSLEMPFLLSEGRSFHLSGESRIIDICKKQKAKTYLNLPGGENLYSKDSFRREDIDLSFIKPNIFEYRQLSKEFISHLSIIDVIMNVPPDELRDALK